MTVARGSRRSVTNTRSFVVHSEKPATRVLAGAHAVRAVHGPVPENVQRAHGRQELARVHQLHHTRRARRSARVGIRLFRGRQRRRDRGKV